MRYRFKETFNYHMPPFNGQVTKKFVRGGEYALKRDEADAAIRAGVVEEVKEPHARKAGADK